MSAPDKPKAVHWKLNDRAGCPLAKRENIAIDYDITKVTCQRCLDKLASTRAELFLEIMTESPTPSDKVKLVAKQLAGAGDAANGSAGEITAVDNLPLIIAAEAGAELKRRDAMQARAETDALRIVCAELYPKAIR